MWSVEFLDDDVFAEMEAQPEDIKTKFEKIVQLIKDMGLERVHEPHIKHLESTLWEMRMKGRDRIARAIYVTVVEKRVIVVRVFTKKSQKTPRREIKIALKRAEDAIS